MKKCLVIFIFLFAVKSFAQQNPDIKRTWHWYFGNGAGLDFSSGTAVADTNGHLHAKEGCAAISNTLGNLLFYTDGDTIWDRTHNPMPNGTGLSSSVCSLGYLSDQNSSLQGAIIIPHPGNLNQYYLFTTDCEENLGIDGFRYNLIDMTLNSGLGDVAKKRKLLLTPSTEMLTAVKNKYNKIWIITHGYNNALFYSYLIDSNGLDTVPRISNTGPVVNMIAGSIKISPDAKYLVIG